MENQISRILLIGQCSLHWGRMEFGNIGNYYVLEPLIREIHRVFPKSEIRTTLQLSDDFCERESVTRLPLDLYYGWGENDTATCMLELGIATAYKETGTLLQSTPYIDEVVHADLVLDYSGDMWGENADFLGPNRFIIGAYKDHIAYLLGKKIALIAGSPGPFSRHNSLARNVFSEFSLVSNREPASTELLHLAQFKKDHILESVCPSFLFESSAIETPRHLLKTDCDPEFQKPIVGFILCGWNFLEGPFDKWPRNDEDYKAFAESIEYIDEKLGARVCLMSHSNGFPVPPAPFRLTHGRDYLIIKQLQSVLMQRGKVKDLLVLDGVYSAWETRAIIGTFDLLISGRVHAAVAGLSQYVPTVIIDYGHEPKAHKLEGFARLAGTEELLADPALPGDLIAKINKAWNDRESWRHHLRDRIPMLQQLARRQFDALRELSTI